MKRRQKSRVCYVSEAGRPDFDRSPLLEREKKAVKHVWAALPLGEYALQYPADGTLIDGCFYLFRLKSFEERVILVGVERCVPKPIGLLARSITAFKLFWSSVKLYFLLLR